ncbi:MAG: hypothetical protein RR230_06580 [Oscillospiraceae bacterium]
MKKVEMFIDDCLYEFYKKVGDRADGLSPEQVMSDALFKLAGELSVNALNKKRQVKTNNPGYHT